MIHRLFIFFYCKIFCEFGVDLTLKFVLIFLLVQLFIEVIPVHFIGFLECVYLSSTLLIDSYDFPFASLQFILMDLILIEMEVYLSTHALVLFFQLSYLNPQDFNITILLLTQNYCLLFTHRYCLYFLIELPDLFLVFLNDFTCLFLEFLLEIELSQIHKLNLFVGGLSKGILLMMKL